MNRFEPAIVAFGAAVVRCAYWIASGGVRRGFDSVEYVAWAHAFVGDPNAHGVEGRSQFVLHQLYPVLLAPMIVLRLAEPAYVAFLHIALSTATAVLLFLAARRIGGRDHARIVGALAVAYPSFLFWLPYVLTETTFLFCLALFVLAFVTVLEAATARRTVVFVLASGLMLFCRPVAAVLICSAAAIAGWRAIALHYGRKKAILWTVAGSIVVSVGPALVVANDRQISRRILDNPTVAQSLWLSTRIWTNDLPEVSSAMELGSRMSWHEKAERGRAFIAEHPVEFSIMSANRFVSFWYPWAYASTWSVFHRLFDAVLSLTLTIAAVVALWLGRARLPIASLAWLALSLALLSAVSQIEPDGRYRVPAELLLLVIAPLAVKSLIEKKGRIRSAWLHADVIS